MSVTVAQHPAPYNLVVSPNVWTLQGLTVAEDFYLLNIIQTNEATGTSTQIATIQQPANPAGVGHFDIQKILQSYMDIAFVETTEEVSETAGMTMTYQVEFGSVTGDIPDVDGTSAVYKVYDGYDAWQNINWPSQDLFIPDPFTVPCQVDPTFSTISQRTPLPSYLTNYPGNIPIRSNVYHTLSFFNRVGGYDQGTNWGNNEAPFAVRIKFFDASEQLIQTAIYGISDQTGLGPRADITSPVVGAYDPNEWIGTVGAGPQNLKDAGYWPTPSSALWNTVSQQWGNYQVIWNLATSSAQVSSYYVEICSVNMCYWDQNGPPLSGSATNLEPYLGTLWYQKQFDLSEPCTGYDPITVSFVNQYGVKDYFTFDRRNTQNVAIKRNNYDQQLGSWDAATFSVDPHGRGRRTFSSAIKTTMSMNSYWMDDDEASWLEELFTSPHIQVNYEGVWQPAVITSRRYEQKNATRNGLFQYTLDIEFANNKKVQRG